MQGVSMDEGDGIRNSAPARKPRERTRWSGGPSAVSAFRISALVVQPMSSIARAVAVVIALPAALLGDLSSASRRACVVQDAEHLSGVARAALLRIRRRYQLIDRGIIGHTKRALVLRKGRARQALVRRRIAGGNGGTDTQRDL